MGCPRPQGDRRVDRVGEAGRDQQRRRRAAVRRRGERLKRPHAIHDESGSLGAQKRTQSHREPGARNQRDEMQAGWTVLIISLVWSGSLGTPKKDAESKTRRVRGLEPRGARCF